MIEILQNLEPRFESKDTVLFLELDEIHEVIFVEQGKVDVGFELNRRRKFAIRFTDKVMIGSYNCTFNKKTLFVYRCFTDICGYIIRKAKWLEIIDGYPEISGKFKENIERDYLHQIKNKVLIEKEKEIAKLKISHGQILGVVGPASLTPYEQKQMEE